MRSFRLIALCGALLAAASLSGCAEWQAAASGAHSAGVKMAQNANDDALVLEREAMCATPYSAIVRNVPKVAGLGPAVVALCGPVPSVQVVTAPK